MKIDQNGIVPSTSSVESTNSSATGSSRPRGSGSATGGVQDQTQFSSLGTTASQLRATLNSVPDVRQDRVQYYRQQIAAGTYNVDPQAVAGAILGEQSGGQDGN